MSIRNRSIGFSALLIAFATSAQAGPAMFSASFIMHAFGNDVTSGTAYPNNVSTFYALPLGHWCVGTRPSTTNGSPIPQFCGLTTLRQGMPATGTGTLNVGVGSPASLKLPPSAIVASITGLLPTPYYTVLQSFTYATFTALPATFFAGGGPAFGLGTVTKTGMGQTAGSWAIREGENAFGGALGFLGRYGVVGKFFVTGKPGTYEGTSSWAMVPPIGVPQSQTLIGYTPMGKVRWKNPYIKTETWKNNLNGNTLANQARGTGTLWTTGSVTVYATQGSFTTILHRTGYDTTTPGGVRNLQLVTPALTHWSRPGFEDHTGHIGILTLQVPEPAHVALFAAGVGALVLLHRASRRR